MTWEWINYGVHLWMNYAFNDINPLCQTYNIYVKACQREKERVEDLFAANFTTIPAYNKCKDWQNLTENTGLNTQKFR